MENEFFHRRIEFNSNGSVKMGSFRRFKELKNLPENFDFIRLEPHPNGCSLTVKRRQHIATLAEKVDIFDHRLSTVEQAKFEVLIYTGIKPENQVWE